MPRNAGDRAGCGTIHREIHGIFVDVGVWNAPDRLWAYSPWHNAQDHAKFLTQEQMPRVEA